MLQIASAAARLKVPLPLPASVPQWKRVAFALLLSGLSICLPARGHTAGLDCPEMGPGAVPTLLTDPQSKLMAGNSVDLANEINDLINKLQIEKPNISYAELFGSKPRGDAEYRPVHRHVELVKRKPAALRVVD
jgi:hypothetical protein